MVQNKERYRTEELESKQRNTEEGRTIFGEQKCAADDRLVRQQIPDPCFLLEPSTEVLQGRTNRRLSGGDYWYQLEVDYWQRLRNRSGYKYID